MRAVQCWRAKRAHGACAGRGTSQHWCTHGDRAVVKSDKEKVGRWAVVEGRCALRHAQVDAGPELPVVTPQPNLHLPVAGQRVSDRAPARKRDGNATLCGGSLHDEDLPRMHGGRWREPHLSSDAVITPSTSGTKMASLTVAVCCPPTSKINSSAILALSHCSQQRLRVAHRDGKQRDPRQRYVTAQRPACLGEWTARTDVHEKRAGGEGWCEKESVARVERARGEEGVVWQSRFFSPRAMDPHALTRCLCVCCRQALPVAQARNALVNRCSWSCQLISVQWYMSQLHDSQVTTLRWRS